MLRLGLNNITRKTSDNFKKEEEKGNDKAEVFFFSRSIKIITSLYFPTHTLISLFFYIKWQ